MGLVWMVIAALLALWVVGMLMQFASPVIHALLVVAAILFVVNMFTGGRMRA